MTGCTFNYFIRHQGKISARPNTLHTSVRLSLEHMLRSQTALDLCPSFYTYQVCDLT